LKKEIIKISSFLNGSSSFRIKISEKNKTKNLKNFSSADPGTGSASASKLNGS